MLALFLERIPVLQHLFLGIGLHCTENVRMSVNQFLTYVVANIVEVEIALLGLDLRMEHHLHKQVAQLLAEHFGTVCIYPLANLVSFFDKIGAYAFMRLHLIPRAAVFRSKYLHDIQEVVDSISVFKFEFQNPSTPFKYYPILRYFARGFLKFFTFFCFIMPLVRKTPHKISNIA